MGPEVLQGCVTTVYSSHRRPSWYTAPPRFVWAAALSFAACPASHEFTRPHWFPRLTVNTFYSRVRTDLDNVPPPHSSLSNRLFSPVLVLPVPSPPTPPPPLSAEWLVEMDVMRLVLTGREMEALPWRSAAVNKVKDNQVTVACSSRGGPLQPGEQPPPQPRSSRAAIHHLLHRNECFTCSRLSLAASQLSSVFCLSYLRPVLIQLWLALLPVCTRLIWLFL